MSVATHEALEAILIPLTATVATLTVSPSRFAAAGRLIADCRDIATEGDPALALLLAERLSFTIPEALRIFADRDAAATLRGIDVRADAAVPVSTKTAPDPLGSPVFVADIRFSVATQDPRIPIPAWAYAWCQEGDPAWTYTKKEPVGVRPDHYIGTANSRAGVGGKKKRGGATKGDNSVFQEDPSK